MDCRQFLNCWKGRGTIQSCAPGTLFNPRSLECDHPSKVKCKTFDEFAKVTHDASPSASYTADSSYQNYGSRGHTQNAGLQHRVECQSGVSGLFAHPTDCSKFLNCDHGKTVIQDCGPGTAFNSINKNCDWPQNVDCGSRALHGAGSRTSKANDDEAARMGEGSIDERFDANEQTISSGYTGTGGGVGGGANHHRAGYNGQGSYENIGGGQININAQSSYGHQQPQHSSYSSQQSGITANNGQLPVHASYQGSSVTTSNLNNGGISGSTTNVRSYTSTSTGTSGSSGGVGTYNRQSKTINGDRQIGEHVTINEDDKTKQKKYSATNAGQNGSTLDDDENAIDIEKIKCRKGVSGVYAHPSDCSKYVNCNQGRTSIQDCGPGTVFSPSLKSCDWPKNVNCALKTPRKKAETYGRVTLIHEDEFPTEVGDASTSGTSHHTTSTGYGKTTTDTDQSFNVGAYDSVNRDAQGNRIQCKEGAIGLQPHPFDCTKFLNCDNGRTFIQDCGPGTAFNAELQVCDWPQNVDCDIREYDGPRVVEESNENGESVFGEGLIDARSDDREDFSMGTAATTVHKESRQFDAINSYSQIRRNDNIQGQHTYGSQGHLNQGQHVNYDSNQAINQGNNYGSNHGSNQGSSYGSNHHSTHDISYGGQNHETKEDQWNHGSQVGRDNQWSQVNQESVKIECSSGMTGLNEHPLHCGKFMSCEGGKTFINDCAPGTLFSTVLKICDFPKNVDCGSRHRPETLTVKLPSYGNTKTQYAQKDVYGERDKTRQWQTNAGSYNGLETGNKYGRNTTETKQVNFTNAHTYNNGYPLIRENIPVTFNFSDQNVDSQRKDQSVSVSTVKNQEWQKKTENTHQLNAIGHLFPEREPKTEPEPSFNIPDMSKVPLAEFPGSKYPVVPLDVNSNPTWNSNSNKRVSQGGDVTNDFDFQTTHVASFFPSHRDRVYPVYKPDNVQQVGDRAFLPDEKKVVEEKKKVFSTGREHIQPIYFRPTTTVAAPIGTTVEQQSYNKAYYKPTTDKPIDPDIQTDYLPISEALKILMRPYLNKNDTAVVKDVHTDHTRTMEEKILTLGDRADDLRSDHTVSLEQESLASADYDDLKKLGKDAKPELPVEVDEENEGEHIKPAKPEFKHDENCHHYHPPGPFYHLPPNFKHTAEFHKHDKHWSPGNINHPANHFDENTNGDKRIVSGPHFNHNPSFHHRHNHPDQHHYPHHPHHPNHEHFQHNPNHPYHRGFNHNHHHHPNGIPGGRRYPIDESTTPVTTSVPSPQFDLRFDGTEASSFSNSNRRQHSQTAQNTANINGDVESLPCTQFDCQTGLCLPFTKVSY